MASTTADAHPLTIWTDAARAHLVQQIVGELDPPAEVVAVGGPRDAPIESWAEQLGCPCGDDLRQLLVEHPAPWVLVAARGLDSSDVHEAVQGGAVVLSLDPIDQIRVVRSKGPGRGKAAGEQGRIELVPGFDRCFGWRRAADPMQVLGSPRLIDFQSHGGPASAGLYARLYDAWRTLCFFVAPPESVDASLMLPADQRTELPEDLHAMAGHMSVHARFGSASDGCCATVNLSNHAAVNRRRISVIADEGHLIVSQSGYELFDSQGTPIDQDEQQDADLGYPRLIGDHWQRLIEQPDGPALDPACSRSDLISCCLACLLSARTGQAESPARMLEVHRV